MWLVHNPEQLQHEPPEIEKHTNFSNHAPSFVRSNGVSGATELRVGPPISSCKRRYLCSSRSALLRGQLLSKCQKFFEGSSEFDHDVKLLRGCESGKTKIKHNGLDERLQNLRREYKRSSG